MSVVKELSAAWREQYPHWGDEPKARFVGSLVAIVLGLVGVFVLKDWTVWDSIGFPVGTFLAIAVVLVAAVWVLPRAIQDGTKNYQEFKAGGGDKPGGGIW